MIDSALINLFVNTWNDLAEGPRLKRDRINYGWCYQFALVVQEVYGGELMSSGYLDHCWVRIGGVDYDSEDPEGACLRAPDEVVMSPDEVSDYWSPIGNSGPVRTDVIDATIINWLNQRAA